MAQDNLSARVRPIIERAKSSVGPVESAEILPRETYVNESFWEFERKAIFESEWLCVGHVNEVPRSGDHLQLMVMDEPVLLVRGQDEVVRVFSALCQHRGHPMIGGVVEHDRSAPCLNRNRLVCPYHNWTYALDGRLVGAPFMNETVSMEELRRTIRLREYRTEIFHGLVFVNFDEQASPLRDRLAKLDRELETYPIEDLVPSHRLALTDLAWNWKLHHENALESYHTDFVHKGLHASVPSKLTQFMTFEPGDGQVMRWTGFAEGDSDLYQSKSGTLPEIENLTAAQRRRVMFVSLMPTVILVMQPGSVVLSVMNPRSASKMEMRRVTLYPKRATEHAEYKRITDENFERMKLILSQDGVTQEALQIAYHSRYTPRGRLSRLESAIPQLNAWVVERYLRGLSAGL
jgi:phenylpropionate dioxygenase-like ring-hydroxylating dioxygenase large terminal subunit